MVLYEKQQAQLELYKKLMEAEAQSLIDERRKSHKHVMNALPDKINAKL